MVSQDMQQGVRKIPSNLYQALWMFILYAFIGWCAEVTYTYVNKSHFVNRGFLKGPYCPIYGCGILAVVLLLEPLKDNLVLLFVGAFALTTALEYITGLILEKVFKKKWWDYSTLPFNIHGYVCLKFSILWGLGCCLMINEVHPMMHKLIEWIPPKAGVPLLTVIFLVFMVDVVSTIYRELNLHSSH